MINYPFIIGCRFVFVVRLPVLPLLNEHLVRLGMNAFTTEHVTVTIPLPPLVFPYTTPAQRIW